jgi:hypothetical protein
MSSRRAKVEPYAATVNPNREVNNHGKSNWNAANTGEDRLFELMAAITEKRYYEVEQHPN